MSELQYAFYVWWVRGYGELPADIAPMWDDAVELGLDRAEAFTLLLGAHPRAKDPQEMQRHFVRPDSSTQVPWKFGRTLAQYIVDMYEHLQYLVRYYQVPSPRWLAVDLCKLVRTLPPL
jgi:hypothetical protein